jgi:hypothetical protein
MAKLRITFSHTSLVSAALAALLLSAQGCGKTTRIGDIVPVANGGTDGEEGSAAGSTSDGAAGTSSGGDSGGSAGGAAGEAGNGGSAAAADSGTKTACGLPRPDPLPNPTSAEQQRAALIRTLCERLAELDCFAHYNGRARGLSWHSEQVSDCPSAERTVACEQDLAYSYLHEVTAPCDDEWQTLIRCEAAEYGPQHCVIPSKDAAPPPCAPELMNFHSCATQNENGASVTGTRARCWYGPGTPDPSTCAVTCTVATASSPETHFATDCSAPPGLPLRCQCYVNGNILHNVGLDHGQPFSASNCREVAQQMADGECIERLDCCIQYPTANGGETCLCMANDKIGMPSCEAAAQAAGGAVVDICPQYKPRDDGSCWPPWNNACPQQSP